MPASGRRWLPPTRGDVCRPRKISSLSAAARKACDAIKLNPKDIIAYEFHWKRFCEFLAAAGLLSVAEPLRAWTNVWHVGSWVVNATDRHSVAPGGIAEPVSVRLMARSACC